MNTKPGFLILPNQGGAGRLFQRVLQQSGVDRRRTLVSLTDKARELERLLGKALENLKRSETDLKRGKDGLPWRK